MFPDSSGKETILRFHTRNRVGAIALGVSALLGAHLAVTDTVARAQQQQQQPAPTTDPPAAQQPPDGRGQPPAGGRGQQPTQATGPGRGRPIPPQPQQKQGVEYFVGTWTFTGVGRESELSVGPKAGSTTFTRQGTSNVLEYRTEGKLEDGNAAFKESGTATWDEGTKTMTFKETLSNGTTITGPGNWSSPLAIRFESEPVKVGGQTLKLRRTYSILSAHSFSITEELSTDGGPYQRLGNSLYSRSDAAK